VGENEVLSPIEIKLQMDKLERSIAEVNEELAELTEVLHNKRAAGQNPVERAAIPVETFLTVNDDEAYVAQGLRVQKRFRHFLAETGLKYPEILELYNHSETHNRYPKVWLSVSLLSRMKRVSAYVNPTTGNWYHITSPQVTIATAEFLREQGY